MAPNYRFCHGFRDFLQKNGCDPDFWIQALGGPSGGLNAKRAGTSPAPTVQQSSRTLELDRDAAEDPPADAVGGNAGGGIEAAAELHVELHGPVGGEIEQEIQVLVDHELEALEVGLGR